MSSLTKMIIIQQSTNLHANKGVELLIKAKNIDLVCSSLPVGTLLILEVVSSITLCYFMLLSVSIWVFSKKYVTKVCASTWTRSTGDIYGGSRGPRALSDTCLHPITVQSLHPILHFAIQYY